MTEDVALEALVKKAFEEDAGVGSECLRAIERLAGLEADARQTRRWRFGASALAVLTAASLAVAVAWHVGISGAEAADRGGVEEAIRVLCAVDGIDGVAVESASAGEMLLAWQDAPCADLLSRYN